MEINGRVMGFQRESNRLYNGFTIELEHGILIGLFSAVKYGTFPWDSVEIIMRS